MRLSRACGYAIQAVVAMAEKGSDRLAASYQIAQEHNIPEGFLLKVLGQLAAAGLLESTKGPRGGFRLARPAAKLTLLEVVESLDGPVRGDVPVLGGKGTAALDAKLRDICQDVADRNRKVLGKVRLSELTGGAGVGKK